MVKYVKLIVEDNIDIKNIMPLIREFASKNFKKSTIYAWNSERTDDTYTVSFPEPKPFQPCSRLVGKIGGKDLVCGLNDYLCPECQKLVKQSQ